MAPHDVNGAPALEGSLTVRLIHASDIERPSQAPEKKEPSVVAALDRARELKAEIDRLQISQGELARRRGLTAARVSQLLSLLKLPSEVIDQVESLRGRPLGERYLTERALRRSTRGGAA